jgi:hypothetical protein
VGGDTGTELLDDLSAQVLVEIVGHFFNEILWMDFRLGSSWVSAAVASRKVSVSVRILGMCESPSAEDETSGYLRLLPELRRPATPITVLACKDFSAQYTTGFRAR